MELFNAAEKLAEALSLSDHIDSVIKGKIYKDGIYKDDDVTIKQNIHERDIEELINIVKVNTDHLKRTEKELKAAQAELTLEDQEKITQFAKAGEEFYLKGSTNFITGFDAPMFYVQEGDLFFSVEVMNGEIDLAEITTRYPGEKPSTRVEGGVIKDDITVKVPIKLGSTKKDPTGTTYKVSLTSTNNLMKATFNYASGENRI
jgi:hypothetical protein